ncbi:MAG: argininosuccinate synthase [Candidatus Poribacteria bacterium]|nr:MAG: argininosuccinate synthase [Candidatus Poribacteria bacterium]
MVRNDLIGKRVLALVSGGLDSTTIVHWLSSAGVEVTAVTVDLGQPDEPDLSAIPARMKAAGAADAFLLDGKERLAEYMLQVIHGMAYHEGGYWNTTGIARMAAVATVLPVIRERKIDVVTHGATGRGNDQVRFELALAMLEPRVRVYAPWRDPEFTEALGGRRLMIEYCRRHGLNVTATEEKPYSTDANFCGLTHEAGKLESLSTPTDFVEFKMGVSPMQAPDRMEEVTVEWEMGVPVRVNEQPLGLVEVFQTLNEIAGRNGVGIGIDAVENRRIGIKSRGVYESPGVTLLGILYDRLLQLILDRSHRKFFEIVSRQLADVVYEGEWFSPLAASLLQVTERVAQFATGKLKVGLYKGNVRFLAVTDVPHSLYDEEGASMEKIGELRHEWAQGYLELADYVARGMADAGLTRKP